MNLRQLEYFLAVVERGSILKASQAVHVSQPSVSVQLKSLEDELGVQLLERRHDGVVLTPEGEELAAHARGVLRAIQTARTSMQAYHASPSGSVIVGIPGSLAALLTAGLVERVWAELPAVQLRVVGGLSGHTRQWILDGRMDFGLVFDEAACKGVDVQHLFSEALYLAATGDRLAELAGSMEDGGRLPWRAAARLPLVLPGQGYALRTAIESAAQAAGVALDVRAEVDATAQIGEIVSRSGYYTILSLAAIQDEVQKKRLSTLRIGDPDIVRTVSLAHASGRPLSRAARAVGELFRGVIREKIAQPWWGHAVVQAYI